MGNAISSGETLSPEQLEAIEKIQKTEYENHSLENYIITAKDVEENFLKNIISAKLNNNSTSNQELLDLLDSSKEESKQAFPSKECYLFPIERKTEYELDANDESIILSRRIFENKKGFDEQETVALKSLYLEIEKHNIVCPGNRLIFPPNWKISETLKFLQATKFDNKQTIQNLINHTEWRKGYFPMKVDDKVIEILSKLGFLYIHGRDRYFRPIIVCRAQAYVSNVNKYSYEEFLSAIIFFMEYVINFLMVPGQVECWNIINDLNNVSLLTLPSDFNKFLKFLQINYRCRLNISFVYGMNTILDYLWRLIKTFLDKNVEKKFMFVNDGNRNRVFELILPEQLEERYGGSAPNRFSDDGNLSEIYVNQVKRNNVFPPIMPNKDNLLIEDKQKLLTEAQYKDLVKLGKITKICPIYDY